MVAVLLFDVDGLRDVNESLGPRRRRQAARRGRQRLRDIAAGRARWSAGIGGDEFVVTLRVESAEATCQLATQMREQLRDPMVVGTLTLDVDTAVGVAVHPDHGSDRTLLQRADLAANAAKSCPTASSSSTRRWSPARCAGSASPPTCAGPSTPASSRSTSSRR